MVKIEYIKELQTSPQNPHSKREEWKKKQK